MASSKNTPGQQTFNTAYPFDVSIQNQFQGEGLSVFYIVDKVDNTSPSQKIQISITQNDTQNYTIKGFGTSAPTPDANNYNLAIVLRSGTLRDDIISSFGATLQTAINQVFTSSTPANASSSNPCLVSNAPEIRSSDGALIWYCNFQKDIQINYSDTTPWNLTFTLNGISAAAGVGSRSTQIEILFANILLNNTGNPLKFNRSKHVDIINHQGHTYAPLFFGVLGKNVLLNEKGYSNELNIYFETIHGMPIQFASNTEIEFNFSFDDITSEMMHFGTISEANAYTLNQNPKIPFAVLKINPAVVLENGVVPATTPKSGSGQVRISSLFTDSQSFNSQHPEYDLTSPWSIGQALFCGYANYIISNQPSIPASYQINADNFTIDNWNTIIKQFLPGIPDGTYPDGQTQYNSICTVGLPDLTWGFQRKWWGWQQTYSSFSNIPSPFDSGNYFLDTNFFNYVKKNFNSLLDEFFQLTNGLNFSDGYNSPLNTSNPSFIYPCRYIYDYWYASYNNYILKAAKKLYNNEQFINTNSFIFNFSNIQISGNDGIVMLGVTIRNLPGYWDTNFHIPIIKETSALNAQLELGTSDSQGRIIVSSNDGNYSDTYRGSRIDFLTGGDFTITYANGTTYDKAPNVAIEEYYGLNLYGTLSKPGTTSAVGVPTQSDTKATNGQPVRIRQADFLVQEGRLGIGNVPDGDITGDFSDPANPSGGGVNPNEKLRVNGDSYLQGHLGISGDVGIGNNSSGSNLDVNGNIQASGGRVKDKTGDVMPVGSIIAFAGATAPDGWLLCDGSAIDASKYPELIVAIGSNNTPDLRSRFTIGSGQGSGLSNYNYGQTGGEENHTLSIAEMPSHQHHGWGEHFDNIWPYGVSGQANNHGANQNDTDNYFYNTSPTGGSQPHNNIPPYFAVNYIIKC